MANPNIPGLLPDVHDPGGRSFPLAPDVEGTAVFGGERDCYRYLLTREWSLGGLTAMFVMMNPSCADPLRDDMTIKGITRKVRSWPWKGLPRAFGRLVVANTFAYRAKDQARLAEVEDPIGPDNDTHILTAAARADLVVMAYGKPKVAALRQRGWAVAGMLQAAGHDLYTIAESHDGVPRHPLYVADSIVPRLWRSWSEERTHA